MVSCRSIPHVEYLKYNSGTVHLNHIKIILFLCNYNHLRFTNKIIQKKKKTKSNYQISSRAYPGVNHLINLNTNLFDHQKSIEISFIEGYTPIFLYNACQHFIS